MRTVLAFSAGLLLGHWLIAWHVEARDRDRVLAARTLARVVEQHPDHAELWRQWHIVFEIERARAR